MSVLHIGKEVAAAGLGLDIAGVVFLGLSVLHSPMLIASNLFGNPHPQTSHGKERILTQPVDAAVAAQLQGRVGVTFLLGGFGLQLLALVLPSSGFHYGAPLLVAGLTFEGARWLGVRWIVENWGRFEESVWRSPRLTAVVERKAALGRTTPRQYPDWQEARVLRWLRQRFGPPQYG
jgi:hypothetical protein